jgi:hypothetical protein
MCFHQLSGDQICQLSFQNTARPAARYELEQRISTSFASVLCQPPEEGGIALQEGIASPYRNSGEESRLVP